jgi:hypothetical protein
VAFSCGLALFDSYLLAKFRAVRKPFPFEDEYGFSSSMVKILSDISLRELEIISEE